MATVTVTYVFEGADHTETREFDVEPGIVDIIDSEGENIADDLALTYEGWAVVEEQTDSNFDSAAFASLDDYAEYIEKVDEHGDAYELRYEDIGDNDFEEYEGCWESDEEFTANLVDECYELEGPLAIYFDYESWNRDVMMDYTSYDGSEGVHIFRD